MCIADELLWLLVSGFAALTLLGLEPDIHEVACSLARWQTLQ